MQKIIELFDKYNREARVYPAILTFFPPWILFISIQSWLLENVFIKLIFSSLSLVTIIYLCSELGRNLGKKVEDEVFGKSLSFPTTVFLLHSNNALSNIKKEKIYKKIYSDFGILLPTAAEERNNILESKKIISEIIDQVRQRLGSGNLLLQYNIRYGFWRNLVSASLLAAMSCVYVGIFAFAMGSNLIGIFAFMMAVVYIFLWFFRESILLFFGQQYAHRLFIEYLDNQFRPD